MWVVYLVRTTVPDALAQLIVQAAKIISCCLMGDVWPLVQQIFLLLKSRMERNANVAKSTASSVHHLLSAHPVLLASAYQMENAWDAEQIQSQSEANASNVLPIVQRVKEQLHKVWSVFLVWELQSSRMTDASLVFIRVLLVDLSLMSACRVRLDWS